MRNTTLIFLISLIILIVLGGIIYLAGLPSRAITLPTQITPTPNIKTTPTPMNISTPLEEVQKDSSRIALKAVDETRFNQVGTAILTEEKEKVMVVLNVNMPSNLDNQPAHIHKGGCPGVGNVVYPLNNVVQGKSETTINTTLANFKKQLPLAINIHKSNKEVNIYTSCGDL